MFPKEDLPYIVDTDASDHGIGGVLSQSIKATEYVITYYSKSLNPAQQKYCTTKTRTVGCSIHTGPFQRICLGTTLRTDHAALVWLTNLKNIQGMLARWLAKLQQFNFDIEHRPGTQHGNADGLLCCPQCERGSCVPTSTSHQHDHEQPYSYSGGESSMDSELITLESGELCVAAIVTTLSDNSKQIVAAQKNDKDITTVRINWISSDTFPECVLKLRVKIILDWPEESIPRRRGCIVAHSLSCKGARATRSSLVSARHHLQ